MSADHHGHGHAHSHDHDHAISENADRRWLIIALALIVTFMAGEVVVGVVANSLALLSDAAHMLTDAASIVLALVAMNLAARPAAGRYTYGLKRAEILSALANGITLLALAAWLILEAIERLRHHHEVDGQLVVITALVGIVVNLLATWALARANRSSLNVEGAFQHILTDLFAFIGTAVAGVAMMFGHAWADPVATLLVAALMVRAGVHLVRSAGGIIMEASPAGLDPDAIGEQMVAVPGVAEVHDLHIWEITSHSPALSAHVLVAEGVDCHAVRGTLQTLLHDEHDIEHTTLQVDHLATVVRCCAPHGRVHTPRRP